MTEPHSTTRLMLIVCAHGTRDEDGQAVIRDLVTEVRQALAARTPPVAVVEAHIDVQEPHLAQVVAEIPDGQPVVVVPLLLTAGYHVYVDIPKAIEGRSRVTASAPLGPDERLVDILMDRISEAGVPAGAAVIFAPAGSSDPRAQADTEAIAALLRHRWSGPVLVGNAADVAPTALTAFSQALDRGSNTVAIASYLLAPGFFQSQLEALGADVLTAPLAPDPRLIEMVIERFDQTVASMEPPN